MDNQEDILDALRDFEKKSAVSIPPVLEQYLGRVASTGETLFPWQNMKPLFVKKLDEVMNQFQEETHMDSLPPSPNVENVKFEAMRTRILNAIDKFQGAPFTIQRLCELITQPKKHYKRADKFLRGVEKNILVVSTVDPFGRKVVSESKNLVNGLDSNGHFMVDGDSTLVSPVATPTASPAPHWTSPVSKTTAPSLNTSDVAKTDEEEMQCSDKSGEATPSSVVSPDKLDSNSAAVEDRVKQESDQSDESDNRVAEHPVTETKDIDSAKELQPETSVEPNSEENEKLASDLKPGVENVSSEAESTSPAEEEQVSVSQTTEIDQKQTVSESSINSQSDELDLTPPASGDAPNLVDSSTSVKSTEESSPAKSSQDQESGGGDEVKKTSEEPSSSDDETVERSHGGGDSETSTATGAPEEGISSSESVTPSPTEPPSEPRVSETPSNTDQQVPAVDSPSQSDETQNVTTQEIPKDQSSDDSFSNLTPKLESDKKNSQETSSDQTTGADGENVSSSSESVAMETEDSSTRSSDSSETTTTTSSSDNFCSTSDIPEPMEQD